MHGGVDAGVVGSARRIHQPGNQVDHHRYDSGPNDDAEENLDNLIVLLKKTNHARLPTLTSSAASTWPGPSNQVRPELETAHLPVDFARLDAQVLVRLANRKARDKYKSPPGRVGER